MTELKVIRAVDRIELLKSGRWSFRQPKKQRASGGITKTHWDYLMDEMASGSNIFSCSSSEYPNFRNGCAQILGRSVNGKWLLHTIYLPLFWNGMLQEVERRG